MRLGRSHGFFLGDIAFRMDCVECCSIARAYMDGLGANDPRSGRGHFFLHDTR